MRGHTEESTSAAAPNAYLHGSCFKCVLKSWGDVDGKEQEMSWVSGIHMASTTLSTLQNGHKGYV